MTSHDQHGTDDEQASVVTGPALARADREAACHLLAEAFAEDPWAAYVLGAPAHRRPRALAGVMRAPVHLSAQRGGLVVEDDGAGPLAVSAWAPLAERHLGLGDARRSGALALPLTAGPGTVRRVTRDEADLDRVMAPLARDGDAYLWVLGVASSARGRGLGRTVVQRTCDQAAARGFARLVLNTDNPANVPLYRALGFELATTATRASGLTAHVMHRRLAPGAA